MKTIQEINDYCEDIFNEVYCKICVNERYNYQIDHYNEFKYKKCFNCDSSLDFAPTNKIINFKFNWGRYLLGINPILERYVQKVYLKNTNNAVNLSHLDPIEFSHLKDINSLLLFV